MRSPTRGGLIQPPRTTVGVVEADRFLRDHLDAGGAGGIDQVAGGLGPEPVIGAPRARAAHPGQGRNRRARWTTASASVTAAVTMGGSNRATWTGVAPAARSQLAAAAERARPATSCPASSRRGIACRPIPPVAPVTRTFMRDSPLGLLSEAGMGGSLRHPEDVRAHQRGHDLEVEPVQLQHA